MKIEPTPLPPRPDLTITFTPYEQDALRTVLGQIIGTGPVRTVVAEFFNILCDYGAERLGTVKTEMDLGDSLK